MALVALIVPMACAQLTNVTDTQSTPIEGAGHDYIKMLSETVNPSNGSLSLRIEVPMPKGRGISLPFAFTYNSNGILHLEPVENLPGYSEWWDDRCSALGGWGTTLPGLCSHYWSFQVTNPNNPSQQYWCFATSDYMFTDASGGRHALGIGTEYSSQSGLCPGGSRGQGGDDQVRASLSNNYPDPIYNPQAPKECPTTVYTPDGTIYSFPCSGAPSSIEDRNGNLITAAGGVYLDTLGRSIVSSSGPAPAPGVTRTWSLAGKTYQVSWTSTTANYPVSSLRVTDPRYYGSCAPPPSVSNVSLTVIHSITLPNSKQFVFHYGTDNVDANVQNSYGLLNEIDYPSGASVKYKWLMSSNNTETVTYPAQNNPQPIPDGCIYQYSTPVIVARYVSHNGGSPDLTQNFTYRTNWNPANLARWTEKDTSVTTLDNARGNSSALLSYVYGPMFVPDNNPVSPTGNGGVVPVENTIKYYDWNNTTAPIRTVTKSWYDQFLLQSEQTTLQDTTPNISSQVNYSYSGGNLPQLTEKDEYDYGATTPTRKTIIRYQNFPGALGMIADKPCQTTVYDSAGSPASDMYLYYDNSTVLCTPLAGGSSLPGIGLYTSHDETNYGTSSTLPRGNVTSKMQVLTGGTSPVTSYTYDETGQVLSLMDPRGNTTAYSYSDSYTVLSNGDNSDYSPGTDTNAYLTSITDALGHTSSFKYDFNNGQLTSARDQNDISANRPGTTYIYSDNLDRPTLVTRPDTGQTTYSYDDTIYLPSVTVAETIDNTVTPNVTKTTKTVMNGLGQVIQTQLTSDPDGPTSVETTYDGTGLVYTRTNPHRTSSSPTDGVTSYFYDALGKVKTVIEPDHSTVATSYANSWTTVTDETGKMRKSQSDAFGRLLEVDEPGPGSVSAGHGSGTVTIGGTEQNHAATAGTASASVNNVDLACTRNGYGGFIDPSGTVYITVNTTPPSSASSHFGGSCNAQGTLTISPTMDEIAAYLARGLTTSGSSGVTASAYPGALIQITANSTGAQTNYSANSSYTINNGTGYVYASVPSKLSGGSDAVSDSGTVSITVNGFIATANYSADATPQQIASSLTDSFNGGSPVSASLSGSTITLIATDSGAGTNYQLSGSSDWDRSHFTNASFNISLSGSNLTGGVDGSLGPTPLVTLYTYNTLNNLTSVLQQGGTTTQSQWRNRSFSYDSLSRLTSATNPESGTITYTYDANGNLSSKRSPKPNQGSPSTTGTVNYCYDSLNRITSKDYNNSTCPNAAPQASYTYDQGTNGIGRRTGMTDGPGSSTWTYDKMGHIATESRTTSSATKSTTYSYNQGGLLASITYPSGRTLNYTYNSPGSSNSAGRPTSVIDATGSINYLTSATYAPQGALQTYTNGFVTGVFTGINTTNTYNSRLQPVWLSATNPTATILSLCYDFHSGAGINQPPCNFPASTTGNNGNVFQIVNNRDSNRTQIFAYDNLNRIQQANSNGSIWGETFTIDPWGNLTNRGAVPGKTYTEPLTASALVNNQLTGFGYDAAGNMTSNNGANYTYNQEGQMTKFITTDTDIYIYDGDGRRVKKNTGAVSLYWYDTSGNVLDETAGNNLTSEYIYFGGKRIARRDANNSVHYYFSDHLGSASVVTDNVGTMSLCPAANSPMNYTTIPTGDEESDYYPYGGEMQLCDRAPQHYKFTGKERDSESGLDFFGARYDASSLGRFMSPDPDQASGFDNASDPQQWNSYAYVGNNPLSRTDPDGRTVFICDSNGNYCQGVKDKDYTKAQQQDQYNHAASLDDLKKHDGSYSNITDSSGNVVGTVMYTHDEGAPMEGVSPGMLGPGDLILFSSVRAPSWVGETLGKVLGATLDRIAGPGIQKLGLEGAAELANTAEVQNLLTKAASTVGNQGMKASSKQIAEEAAKDWVGVGARNIVDRQTGAVVGQISADGTRIARFTSVSKPMPYINLVNKTTGGNLHVRY